MADPDVAADHNKAIALAKEGGLGIIHKNLTTEFQTEQVMKVKRSANGIIVDPVILHPEEKVGRAAELALLNRRLVEALSGRGRVLFIAGEAGSGKTLLLREFIRQARGIDQQRHVTAGLQYGGTLQHR